MDLHRVAESLKTHLADRLNAQDRRGFEVDDVSIHPAGKRRLVRVVVARSLADLDPQDHTSAIDPLSLDEVSDATKAINSILDETDLLGAAPYTLEVSSAGVGTPLVRPAHFRRNVGRLLVLDLVEAVADPAESADGPQLSGRVTARLIATEPDGVRIRPESDRSAKGAKHSRSNDTATENSEVFLPFDRIDTAKVEIEFTDTSRKRAAAATDASDDPPGKDD